LHGALRLPRGRDIYCQSTPWLAVALPGELIVVIRNSVLNGKPQLIEGDKQSWPISFYWKSHTVSLLKCRITILLVEFDLHNGKSLFVPLAKLGFPINYEFRIKSIYSTSCLNLAEHVFAYCGIVYNLYLMGHEKQLQKWHFPLLFPTLCTYLRKINRKKIIFALLHLLWCM